MIAPVQTKSVLYRKDAKTDDLKVLRRDKDHTDAWREPWMCRSLRSKPQLMNILYVADCT